MPFLAPVGRPVLQSSANLAGGPDARRLDEVPASHPRGRRPRARRRRAARRALDGDRPAHAGVADRPPGRGLGEQVEDARRAVRTPADASPSVAEVGQRRAGDATFIGDRGVRGGAAGSGERVAGGGPAAPVLGGAGVSAAGGPVNVRRRSPPAATRSIERVIRRSGGVGRALSRHARAGTTASPARPTTARPPGSRADGRTLVLAEDRRTAGHGAPGLLVLDTRTLKRAQADRAARASSRVDAISPDGGDALRRSAIRKPRSAGGLRGRAPRPPRRAGSAAARSWTRTSPTSRWAACRSRGSMSADGRWAYTLYTRRGDVRPRARHGRARRGCIDLPRPATSPAAPLRARRRHAAGRRPRDARPEHVRAVDEGRGARRRHAAATATPAPADRTTAGVAVAARRARPRACWRASRCSPPAARTPRSRSRSR